MDLADGSLWAAALTAAWHGGRACRGAMHGLSQLASAAVHGRLAVTREREHRATIVAALAVLPPGGTLIDQQPDGGKLTIRIPAHEPTQAKGQADGH